MGEEHPSGDVTVGQALGSELGVVQFLRGEAFPLLWGRFDAGFAAGFELAAGLSGVGGYAQGVEGLACGT